MTCPTAYGIYIEIPVTGDTYISADSPNTNYGNVNGYPGLPVSGYGTPEGEEGIRRTLLYFDFSPIVSMEPGWKTKIYNAELIMYQRDGWINTTIMDLHILNGPWNELTVTWNTTPSFSSDAVASWNTAGPTWMAFTGLNNLISNWANGIEENYGFLIKLRNESEGSDHFNSKEMIPDWQQIPNHLSIEYEIVPTIPNILVSPTSHNFGSTNVESSSPPRTFTISNTGTSDLHILGMALSDTTNYSLNVNGGLNPCGSATPTIISNGSCTITVTFNPSAIGQKDASLTINSDDPDTPTENVLLTGFGAYSKYHITQITDNTYDDLEPKINNNKYVVWYGYNGSDYEIFFYDSTSIVQLTDNSSEDSNPRINDQGYIVWQGYVNTDRVIFVYDGIETIQVSGVSWDNRDPQINNNGNVVWWGNDGNNYEIFLYNGVDTTSITDNSINDYKPQINKNGQIVWYGGSGLSSEIYFYNGTNITKITDNGYVDQGHQISDNGSIVWHGSDGGDIEIFLFDGLSIIQITNNPYDDNYPQINSSGHITWTGYDGSDWEIFLYDGKNVTQITDNSFDDYLPQINDSEYVVWYGYDGSDWEVFLYDGSNIVQISDNNYDDWYPCINDYGYVVWQGYVGSDWEIFLAKPDNPNISVTPNFYDFSPIVVGTSSAPQTFTISNTGTADLNISEMALSDTTNYTLDVNGGTNPCGNTTPTINPDSNCTVTVSFNPSSAGQKDASLIISSDDPDTPTLNVPLSGIGVTINKIEVHVDIKPGTCPNKFILPKKIRDIWWKLPVAILGTEDFDVTTIDPASIRITREGVEGEVAPVRSAYEDVATPYEGELCGCHDLNGDGFMDMILKFKRKQLARILDLYEVAGQTIPLTITGNLKAEHGGTPIEGQDCIKVKLRRY